MADDSVPALAGLPSSPQPENENEKEAQADTPTAAQAERASVSIQRPELGDLVLDLPEVDRGRGLVARLEAIREEFATRRETAQRQTDHAVNDQLADVYRAHWKAFDLAEYRIRTLLEALIGLGRSSSPQVEEAIDWNELHSGDDEHVDLLTGVLSAIEEAIDEHFEVGADVVGLQDALADLQKFDKHYIALRKELVGLWRVGDARRPKDRS